MNDSDIIFIDAKSTKPINNDHAERNDTSEDMDELLDMVEALAKGSRVECWVGLSMIALSCGISVALGMILGWLIHGWTGG